MRTGNKTTVVLTAALVLLIFLELVGCPDKLPLVGCRCGIQPHSAFVHLVKQGAKSAKLFPGCGSDDVEQATRCVATVSSNHAVKKRPALVVLKPEHSILATVELASFKNFFAKDFEAGKRGLVPESSVKSFI